MLAQMIKILLCLMLCLAIVSCDKCRNYQDIVRINVMNIDSVVVKVNDSITGCGDSRYFGVVGSKTHHIKFPINMNVQLFIEDSLWKELYFEMFKNTVLKVYKGCLNDEVTLDAFHRSLKPAIEHKRFIDSSLTDDYCWLLERMDSSYDDSRCVEWGAGGEYDLYCGPY